MHIQDDNSSCIFKTKTCSTICAGFNSLFVYNLYSQWRSNYKKGGWDYSKQFIPATFCACFLSGPEFPLILSSVTNVTCYLTTILINWLIVGFLTPVTNSAYVFRKRTCSTIYQTYMGPSYASMVVGSTTIYAISAYHHLLCEFESRSHEVYSMQLYGIKVLPTGRWVSPGTPVSSTNNTDRHGLTGICWKWR